MQLLYYATPSHMPLIDIAERVNDVTSVDLTANFIIFRCSFVLLCL